MVSLAGSMPAPTRQNNARRFFLIGWTTIILVFGGLLVWSIAAPFEGAVLAPGSVAVESRHKAVQHLEGGIVSELHVREGARVTNGELLIRLDGTPIKAELETIDARLADLVAREARLKAERDGNAELALRALPEDLGASDGVNESWVSQSRLLSARAEARSTRMSILRQRIAQLREKILGLEAEVQSKSRQANLLKDEINDLRQLLEQGLAPRPRLLALERQRSALLGETEALTAEIAATNVQIGEARLEQLSLTDGHMEEVIGELIDVETEIASLFSQRTAALDRLSRLDIRAPHSGRVLGVRTHTVGGVIASGEPIMHIVPEDDRLVTMVRVQPQDIDKISVGQIARLRFSAFNQDETPEIRGEVTKISADAVQDEATGMLHYEVIIALPSQSPLGDSFPIVPGMPVEAMLQTESRNVLSYLTKPLTDSMSRTFRE